MRVAVRDSFAVPDEHERQSGRGAYVHPNLECLDAAKRRRAFARALRVSGPLSLVAVETAIERQAVRGSGD